MRLALVLVCFAFLLSSGTAHADRVDLSEFIDPDARAAAKPRNAETRQPTKKVAMAKRTKASKYKAAKKASKKPRKHARAKRRR